MKNEEIIRHTRYLAKKYKDDTVLTFETNLHMAFTDIANHIEEQAEENSKLKAEIEQLKLYASEIINARNLSEETAVSIRARMQREMILQRENERLKERLEIKDNNFELYSNALEEIEQLKSELEQWQSTNLKLVCELTRIECENNQLKSELEQSVKLPCKVGDVVYIVGKCKDFPPKLDGTMWDSDGGYGTATGYYCPYEDSDLCPFKDLEDCSFAEDKLGIFEDVVCHICIEEDKMWYVCENSNGYETSDFEKTIFLTREEAEQSLKGQV